MLKDKKKFASEKCNYFRKKKKLLEIASLTSRSWPTWWTDTWWVDWDGTCEPVPAGELSVRGA